MTQINYLASFEELDGGFQQKLSGCVVDGTTVPVSYMTPDVDFKPKTFPEIIFYRDDEYFDGRRWVNEPIIDNEQLNIEGNLVSIDKRRAPEPWNVLYVVVVYFKFQEDGAEISKFIRKKFARPASIMVGERQYDCINLPKSPQGAGYKDFGTVEKGKREFADKYLFRVETILDIHDRETVKVVQDVVLNTANQ